MHNRNQDGWLSGWTIRCRSSNQMCNLYGTSHEDDIYDYLRRSHCWRERCQNRKSLKLDLKTITEDWIVHFFFFKNEMPIFSKIVLEVEAKCDMHNVRHCRRYLVQILLGNGGDCTAHGYCFTTKVYEYEIPYTWRRKKQVQLTGELLSSLLDKFL